jgi:hypothetical protein
MDSFRNKDYFHGFIWTPIYVSAAQDSVVGLVTRWTVLGSISDGVDVFRNPPRATLGPTQFPVQ